MKEECLAILAAVKNGEKEFEDVKEKISQMILQQKQNQVYAEAYNELKEEYVKR